MIYYKGFNTKDYENYGKLFTNYNIEVIKQDLINSIFTIKGERINNPDFGTTIPLMMFEPNDVDSQNEIRIQIENIIRKDPRVELVDIDLIPENDLNIIIVLIRLRYIEFNVTGELKVSLTPNS